MKIINRVFLGCVFVLVVLGLGAYQTNRDTAWYYFVTSAWLGVSYLFITMGER